MQRDESLFNAKAQRAAKIRKANVLWQSISFNRLSNDEVIHPIFVCEPWRFFAPLR